MEVGVIFYVRLVIYRKSFERLMLSRDLRPADLDIAPAPVDVTCNIVRGFVCDYMLRDPFTVVVTMWASLQLVWVSMLLVVQMVQIARAQTTFESMRGNTHHASHAAEAITSALTAGSTSMAGAQISNDGAGPNPAIQNTDGPSLRRHEGCFDRWKKLLGLDTFIATASGGSRTRRHRNPFSRGVVTNCKDFWCDAAPLFGRRETGTAMLDGAVVNYARMYESPPRMKIRQPTDNADGGVYYNVNEDDIV